MGRQSLNERAKRSGTTPAQITKRRSAAVDQMNSKLRRKFTQIEKKVNDLRAENLRFYHKIGEVVLDIKQHPEEYVGHDGTPGIKLIEEALSTQARTLRKAASFAETYSNEELDELISMYNTQTNFQLHWGHVSFLLTLPAKEQRVKYAMEAVEKMWDPSALHDAIKRRTSRGAGHGRGHEMPATVAAQVRQIKKITDQWVKKNANVWNGEDKNVFENVMNHPPEEMTDELLADLREVKELFTDLIEGVASSDKQLDRVIEHVNGVLEARATAEANAQEHGKEQRNIDLGDDEATTESRPKKGGRRRQPSAA